VDRAKPEDLDASLQLSLDHLKNQRSENDILYETPLKHGLDLCVGIEKRIIAGKDVHAVGGGILITCLAPNISRAETERLALGIAEWRVALVPGRECFLKPGETWGDVAPLAIECKWDPGAFDNGARGRADRGRGWSRGGLASRRRAVLGERIRCPSGLPGGGHPGRGVPLPCGLCLRGHAAFPSSDRRRCRERARVSRRGVERSRSARALCSVSAEWRHPLIGSNPSRPRVIATLFADAGNHWAAGGGRADPAAGVGCGALVRVPWLRTLNLEVAYPLTGQVKRRPAAIYLSLGRSF
jgi:hypothetical protein